MPARRPTRTALAALSVFFCVLILSACAEETTVPLEAFYEYDKDFPLEPKTRLVEDTARYSIHHVTYQSTRNQRVTALLSRPKPANGPVPVILLLHGLDDSKSADYMGLGNRIFLTSGYAVFRIDAYNHGERKQYDYELDLTEGYRYWSREVAIQTVFDLRRAVDYLFTLPEIDSERIGYFGVSFGGLIGVVFTGIDERAQVPVIALAGGGLNLLFGAKAISPAVDDFLSVIEPLNFVHRISPRPLLMINARHDETVPGISTNWLYARAKEPKHIIWYDTKHDEIPREKAFGEAVKWFDRYLGE